MSTDVSARLASLLELLYGGDAPVVKAQIVALCRRHSTVHSRSARGTRWSERDARLIAYPDQFHSDRATGLTALDAVYRSEFAGILNGLHVLPFYPWSSDDGYSVIDPDAVDMRYGTWDDIDKLASTSRLMVDAVINHLSVHSPWFRGFLDDDPQFRGFFRTSDPSEDLEQTVRPRTHPLLTPFRTSNGEEVWVWTTFSADQADLDFSNPAVLLKVLATLLTYATHGAAAIRLDAVAFVWKEEGTSSIHLPQTHALVRIIRDVLNATYPDVLLLTETNVPHEENASYFGGPGEPEADGVYLFTLAPLVLNALLTGEGAELRQWLTTLGPGPGAGHTYLTFLASHDGVGVRPAEGWLSGGQIEMLVDRTLEAGGQVGWRTLADGSRVPYELNSTWFDLMSAGVDETTAMARHLAAHALMLAVPGLPLLYVHSLLGTSNDAARFEQDGFPRALNRGRVDVEDMQASLRDPSSRQSRVLTGMRNLLEVRTSMPQFHPDVPMDVLDTPHNVIGIERRPLSGPAARVYVELGGQETAIHCDPTWQPIKGQSEHTDQPAVLAPYGTAWFLQGTP